MDFFKKPAVAVILSLIVIFRVHTDFRQREAQQ